ncbi:ATP-binding cassette domain-containing protein [bacterium]|nr:MAG: ATP-binding cassette domain-containing protein [bacterium]
MSNSIIVQKLSKFYDEFQAVKNISFTVEKGGLFAFVGPNGAGKSTTINILSTTLGDYKADNILINNFKLGLEDDKIRNSIGIVFQTSILDNLLTVKENLKIRSELYNLSNNIFQQRLDYLSEMIGMKDILEKYYGKLSGGQKRRVDIARALLHEPEVLFLDEPTTGLDPQTRVKVWEVIDKIRKEKQMTIFLTTHYMEEIVNADKVAIIDNGQIIAQDTPMSLKQKYARSILRLAPKNLKDFMNDLKKSNVEFQQNADTLEIQTQNCFEAFDLVNKFMIELESFEIIEGNMDQVFINLTGKQIR